MKALQMRLSSSIFVAILLAGLLSISQLGSPAFAQTPASATGDTLVSGYSHSCGLVTGGQVQCWGQNDHGQLGNDTTTDSPTPVTVTGLAGPATALTAGGDHTCAILTDGQVQCWGWNERGQLGNGTTTDSPTPVTVTGLAGDATSLTAGGEHTCAMLTDGQARCWGNNDFGQLGNGTTTDSPTPVTVTGLSDEPTALTAGGGAFTGGGHTCAILTGGQARCWGNNDFGQLGNGTTTDSPTPVTVTGLDGEPTALTAGGSHTCALLADDPARCWGWNNHGQLGNGTTTNSTTPISVTGLTGDATSLTASGLYTCAIVVEGQIQCWGNNGFGQLGDGTTDGSPTPVTVTGLASAATAVAGGFVHACVLLSDGQARCWGYNGFGQLGNGTTTDSTTPVTVTGLAGPIIQPGGPLNPVDPPVDPPAGGSSIVGSLQLLGSLSG